MKHLLALILSVFALVSVSSASAFPASANAAMTGMAMSRAATPMADMHHDQKGGCCDEMPKGCAEACGMMCVIALPDAPIAVARDHCIKSTVLAAMPVKFLVGVDPASLDRPPRLTV